MAPSKVPWIFDSTSAWREAPFYSERERVALEWTEALTLIADNHVPDDIYELVATHFTEEELVNLTLAVVTINAWNRFAISFRCEPGIYQPQQTITPNAIFSRILLNTVSGGYEKISTRVVTPFIFKNQQYRFSYIYVCFYGPYGEMFKFQS